MNTRVIIRIGVAISVLLFCIAVGFYSFASLQEAGKGKDVDLFSLIPDDAYGILETDNVDYYINEFSRMSYSYADTAGHRSGGMLFGALEDLNKITISSPHGISSKVSRVIISTHDPERLNDDVIAYFKADKGGKQYLLDLLNKKYNYKIVSRSEDYRGEKIEIFSLGNTSKFFSAFIGDGFVVVSYHKRLIENVIDAVIDKTSIKHNPVFSKIDSKKSVNYMAFYFREASFPGLSVDGTEVWSEFELHVNTDVIYLSGAMYQSDDCVDALKDRLMGLETVSGDRLLVASGQEKVDSCITDIISKPHDAIFDECVSNLSRDASYIMVVDMDMVETVPDRLEGYFPGFIFKNIDFFRSFIMSLQITEVKGKLSHIYVFTYKY